MPYTALRQVQGRTDAVVGIINFKHVDQRTFQTKEEAKAYAQRLASGFDDAYVIENDRRTVTFVRARARR